MAQPGDAVPRRRGRPKADNAALLDDVLRVWHQLDPYNLGTSAMQRAVRDIATPKRAEQKNITVKQLRERLYDELSHLTVDTVLEWERIEVERQRAEAEAESRARLSPLEAWQRQEAEAVQRAEHLERLVLFYRALNDILPPDVPISVVAGLFEQARRAARHAMAEERG